MPISLNKKSLKITRNKDAESENGGIFGLIHKNLSFLTRVAFLIILAPTAVISSLLSQASFLMIANIFLALGFLFHFCHRVYLNEISYSEILITLIVIGLLCWLAVYLSPAISCWTLLSTLCFINLFSTNIVAFFLIRSLVVPPLQSGLRALFGFLGFEISTDFYYTKPLNREENCHIVELLLSKMYPNIDYDDAQLEVINANIVTLNAYLNKYDQPILGYINNNDKIRDLEAALSSFVLKGNIESSRVFIKRKISFKSTKIKLLTEALNSIPLELQITRDDNNELFSSSKLNNSQESVSTEANIEISPLIHNDLQNNMTNTTQSNEATFRANDWHRFFHVTFNETIDAKNARCIIESEINRQQNKIDKLSRCLP